MERLYQIEAFVDKLTRFNVKNILENILDLSTDGWWIWHIPSGYDYLSKGWLNLLGYQKGQLLNHVDTWYALMHPDYHELAEEKMREHLNSGGQKPYHLVAKYRHKDGHWVILEDTGRVIEWDVDKPILMVGFERLVKHVSG